MKLIPLLLAGSAFLLSSLSFATEISLQARAYSSSACAYYTTSLADFRFHYQGDLPYGSRVRVRYGFYGFNNTFLGTGYHDWLSLDEREMTATAPYTWEASIEGIQVDSRGSSFYDQINFVFQILLPNGDVRFENGGSNLGYYAAQIPGRACVAETFVTPTISIVTK